jgi:hypothetical protein
MINWKEWVQVEKQRYEKMTLVEKFRKFALDLEGLPYIWGNENPLTGTDCSGTICYPLLAMGYNIRTTANELFNKLFIDEPNNEYSLKSVMAVFYITEYEKQHGNRVVPKGTAVHVTPVVGLYVVLNAGNPVKLMTAKAVRLWYEKKGCKAIWRQLNIDKLNYHSKKYDMCFGIDSFLEELFNNGK